MSQSLIQILTKVIIGNIPSNLIFTLLMLGLSEMLTLILPLSLFLGILIAFGRLYFDSEMVVFYACGIKKSFTYQVVAVLALLSCSLSIINSSWLGPWSTVQEAILREDIKVNPKAAGLLSGQFQVMNGSASVIYVGQINSRSLNNVFIYNHNNNKEIITIANAGSVKQDALGNQLISLDNATLYESSGITKEYKISDLADYESIIIPKKIDEVETSTNAKALSFKQLKKTRSPGAKAEFFWRITSIIAVPLLAFLVLPLCASNPRQGKFNQILPALLLYLIYFLAMSYIKANGSKGKLSPEIWNVIVNLFYFVLVISINIWDTTPIRKLRFKLFNRSLS